MRDTDFRITLCPNCRGARVVDAAAALAAAPAARVACAQCGGLGVQLVPTGRDPRGGAAGA